MAIRPQPVRLDRPAWVLVWLTGHYCDQVVGGRVHGSLEDAQRAHQRFCVKGRSDMAKCIVVYDDEQAVCQPATADPECDGGLCFSGGPVMLFPDAKAARKAIRISAAFARLRTEQGLPANVDLTEYRKFVKVRPCAEMEGAE